MDFVPLFILTIYAVILIWSALKLDFGFLWKHIAGLILLSVIYILFWWRHKIGVIGLGFALFAGLLSLISFSQNIITATYTIRIGEIRIPVFDLLIVFNLDPII